MKDCRWNISLVVGLCFLILGFLILSCSTDEDEMDDDDFSSNPELTLPEGDGESDDDSGSGNHDIDGSVVETDPDDDEDVEALPPTVNVSSWTYLVDSEWNGGQYVLAENQGLDSPDLFEGVFNRVEVSDFYPSTWKFYLWFDFTLGNQIAFKVFELYDEEETAYYYSLLAIKPVLFLMDGEVGEEIINTSWGLFRYAAMPQIPYNVEIVSRVVARSETVEVPFGVIEGCTHIEVVLTELVDLGFVDGPVQYWTHPVYGIVKGIDIPYYSTIELVDAVVESS